MNKINDLDNLEKNIMNDARNLSRADFKEKYHSEPETVLEKMQSIRASLTPTKSNPTTPKIKLKSILIEHFLEIFYLLCVLAMLVSGIIWLFGDKGLAKITFGSAIGMVIASIIVRFLISTIWSFKSVGKIADDANDYDKSLSLMSSGNYKKAIAILSKLVKEDHENQDYWFKLGEAYDDVSNFDAALPCYQKCTQLASSGSSTFAPTAYNNIGRIYSKKANYKKAREYFEIALQMGSPLAKDNLAILDRIENRQSS